MGSDEEESSEEASVYQSGDDSISSSSADSFVDLDDGSSSESDYSEEDLAQPKPSKKRQYGEFQKSSESEKVSDKPRGRKKFG